MRILLVDDEPALLSALQQLLQSQHYTVDVAIDGETGLELAMNNSYDLFVLDVMLPGMMGFEVVERLRRDQNSTPILMLTAKDSVVDRVRGLDSGADDYLVKPFAIQEFLARIRALTRRSGDLVGTDEFDVGCFHVDLVARTVSLGSATLALSSKQFQVLEFFLRHPNKVLPKELILDRIWDIDTDIGIVETYVHFLRKKFESHLSEHPVSAHPQIETLRGVGYRLSGV